jgi:hypothetical protein
LSGSVNTQGGSFVVGNLNAGTFVGRDQYNIQISDAQVQDLVSQLQDMVGRLQVHLSSTAEASEQKAELYYELMKLMLESILTIQIFRQTAAQHLKTQPERLPITWKRNITSCGERFADLAERLQAVSVPAHAKGAHVYIVKAAAQFDLAATILTGIAEPAQLPLALKATHYLLVAGENLQTAAGIIVRAVYPTIAQADGGTLAVKFWDKLDFSKG